MTHRAATDVVAPTERQKPDLLGIAYLGTITVVMLAWIGGLVWAAIAFFSWLVS
ncbi:hypothetical protein JQ581_29730 [Bradyrhizobium liaoningense]|uniref:hypothetical protein n=1 Tax=Bradyrhizobium liaoningense TaxID=43992 RepID=UPI001BAC0510|nr:hypothetical protein [Bradyrhizobium liaoningense]MBR0741119.1 hypothetical protein [Bradyrhizobium liaoningense]